MVPIHKIDRFCHILIILCVFLLIVSCATLDVVPVEKLYGEQLTADAMPVAHLHAKNWGLFLFKFIPLVTGNLKKPDYPQLPAFFCNNVTIQDVVEMVTKKSFELGGTLTTDMQSTSNSYWLSWSFILWQKEAEVSANASKK